MPELASATFKANLEKCKRMCMVPITALLDGEEDFIVEPDKFTCDNHDWVSVAILPNSVIRLCRAPFMLPSLGNL